MTQPPDDGEAPGPGTAAAGWTESVEDLYESAPCACVSTLPDGTIVRVNRTFEAWTGFRRESLAGAVRFQDLLSTGGRIYHETHHRPLLHMQGFVRELAYELVCADGRRLPVLVNATLRTDAHDRPAGVLIALFTATDRRAYEQELLRAQRDSERLRRHNELLAEAGRRLDAPRSVASRATALVDLLVERGAEGVVLLLGHGDGTTTATIRGDAELETVAARALRTGRTQRAGDAPGRSPAIAVPLVSGSRTLGALALAPFPMGGGYGEEDLTMLTALADRAAVAIANAQLYEREHAVALTFQRSMLSGRPPEDPRCAISFHYSPGVEALEVGGDWYDAIQLAPGRVRLAVGDVVGKGLEAAATMGQLRSAMRALAVAGASPGETLSDLDLLVEHTEHSRGATVAVADVELDAGAMRLACAGHPPPVLLAPRSAPELSWAARSGPLGTRAAGERRPEAELHLAPGTRVLLYTDGAVERRGETLDEGIGRLARAFERRRGEAVAGLAARLTEDMTADGLAADDVCLLVFAFTPAIAPPAAAPAGG